MIYKTGTITEQQLLNDIAVHMPTIWKPVGRVLGLEEHVLEAIEIDNLTVNERALQMLLKWRQCRGSQATYQVLGEAFHHHSVCRGDLAVKFCTEHNDEGATSQRVPVEMDDGDQHLHLQEGVASSNDSDATDDEQFQDPLYFPPDSSTGDSSVTITEDMRSLSLHQGRPVQSNIETRQRLVPRGAPSYDVHQHQNASANQEDVEHMRMHGNTSSAGAPSSSVIVSTDDTRSLFHEEDQINQPTEIPSVTILLGEPFHKTYKREKELQMLHDHFMSLDPDNIADKVTAVYITGPPGSGKTQLSRLYSEWYSQRLCSNSVCSTVVATLHAETPESLLESYQQLTCALGVEIDDDGNHDDVMMKLKLYSTHVKRIFQRTAVYNFEWLLVVDNVFALNPLKEFWPVPGSDWGRGQVIVTTQDSELAPNAHTHSSTLSLSNGMDKDDAIKFLCLISGLERDQHCDVVAKELNYYPLSLACAAVYIRDMRIERPAANFSWENYMSNLKNYLELLQYSEFTDHNRCYPTSMLPAVYCSASRMSESSSVLKWAFKFLSFCTIQPVPLELVAEAVMKNIGEVMVPDDVKKILARCSLLNYPRHGVRGIEVVAMHQVMKAAFVQLRKETCKTVAGMSGRTVDQVDRHNFTETANTLCEYYHRFRVINKDAISTRIILSPHLQGFIDSATVMNQAENEGFIDVSICYADSLIHVSGGTDHYRVQLLEKAREIQQKIGLRGLTACRLLNDLGYTYREAGRLDDVIPVLEEANRIGENIDGTEGMKQRSSILNVLGWTYRETYQLDLASAYMHMSVEVTKQAYGNQHAEVIERLCNYGIILNDRWKNEEAVEVMKEARKIAEYLGMDAQSAVCAQVFNYSAKIYLRWYLGLYYSEGRTERAEELLNISKTLHEEALDIYERLHGKEHKFYLGTAMTYATVLCHLGDIELGAFYCKEALRVYRSSGHLAWPRVATILADIYIMKECYNDAKKLLTEAIKGLNDFRVDMTNPRAWLPHVGLAEAMIYTGEREEGVKILKKCLEMWEQEGLDPGHYWLGRVRKVLAKVNA